MSILSAQQGLVFWLNLVKQWPKFWFSQCYWLLATAFKCLLDEIRLGTCLIQEQFEEHGWDNHIGARVWHDQLIDWIGSFWQLSSQVCMYVYIFTCMHIYIYIYIYIYKVLSVHLWSGRPGFNPRLSHTKDSKISTWCLLAQYSAL